MTIRIFNIFGTIFVMLTGDDKERFRSDKSKKRLKK